MIDFKKAVVKQTDLMLMVRCHETDSPSWASLSR